MIWNKDQKTSYYVRNSNHLDTNRIEKIEVTASLVGGE